jgi:hypothetical protein
MKNPETIVRLRAAVASLTPIVQAGPPSEALFKLVEAKVKDVLGCLLPTHTEQLLDQLKEDHKAFVECLMCPQKEHCGKSGCTPTAMWCKKRDEAIIRGIFAC